MTDAKVGNLMRPTLVLKMLCFALPLIPLLAANGRCQPDPATATMTATTRFTYHAGAADTPGIAQALSLFGAKLEAVRQAAARLSREDLLPPSGKQPMAVFCLVADEMPFSPVEASVAGDGRTFATTIRSELSMADFIRADIRNARLDREEQHFDLKAEMEPAVGTRLQPGLDLSRAYRYLGHEDWRKTIIYLDNLQHKYPHWDMLFMVKAQAYQGMHETALAREAFAEACRLGNRKACSAADISPPPE